MWLDFTNRHISRRSEAEKMAKTMDVVIFGQKYFLGVSASSDTELSDEVITCIPNGFYVSLKLFWRDFVFWESIPDWLMFEPWLFGIETTDTCEIKSCKSMILKSYIFSLFDNPLTNGFPSILKYFPYILWPMALLISSILLGNDSNNGFDWIWRHCFGIISSCIFLYQFYPRVFFLL